MHRTELLQLVAALYTALPGVSEYQVLPRYPRFIFCPRPFFTTLCAPHRATSRRSTIPTSA
jgi:hypothetical protein